jgi:hypothetical protein
MTKRRKLVPSSVWDKDAVLQAFFEAGIGKAEFHATRLWGHLIRYPGDSWQNVPGLPDLAKSILDSNFTKFTSRLHAVQRSSDGETMKLLLMLQDGLRIESVVMRYDTKSASEHRERESGGVRSTLCVSSQVGCKMGCKFCATGAMISLYEPLSFVCFSMRTDDVFGISQVSERNGKSFDEVYSVRLLTNLLPENLEAACPCRHDGAEGTVDSRGDCRAAGSCPKAH